VILGESIASAGSLSGLYFLWYSDYPSSSFHWFNDNDEWLLMDKFGHLTTSYYVGKIGFDLLRWSHVDYNKSLLYGGGLGFAYLSIVEVMDGFSQGWGASWGDLGANAFGSALFISQQAAWKEQRILMKWSFHQTEYPMYRPQVLGENLIQEMLKDYNGQTYWLSANLQSLMPNTLAMIPPWLNLALGYSGEGMIKSSSNPPEFDHIERYRQYYLSLDIDLTRIECKRPGLRTALQAFGFIKVPFPTLYLDSRGQFSVLPIYF